MKNLILMMLGFLISFSCVAAEQKTTANLYLIGDSTMAEKLPGKRPETGWGEKLADYFSADLAIHNHAVNGRSSKSFRHEGRWQVVLDQLEAGDFVIIQFGHNDEKIASPDRYTNPYSSYRYNLLGYVEDTRARGATPILMSSIVRRNFNTEGSLIDDHGPYPAVARELAFQFKVDFVDLNWSSEMLVTDLGKEKSRSLYLHLAPGENDNYPEGVQDNTHLRPAGAAAIAELAVKDICVQHLTLSRYLLNCPKAEK